MSTKTFRHITDIKATAFFSSDKVFRYNLVIERITASNGQNLCVIMQNPSIADSTVADKSVHFLEKLVFVNKDFPFENVSKMAIVNQFALVQTKNFNEGRKAVGAKNDKIIKEQILLADIVLIAWGKSNPYKERQLDILDVLKTLQKENIYITKKHPSRGSYKNFIDKYAFPQTKLP